MIENRGLESKVCHFLGSKVEIRLAFGVDKHQYSNTLFVPNVYRGEPDGRSYIIYLAKYGTTGLTVWY